MQPGNNAFITAQEAIELIKAHTNEEPVVDLRFLVVNRDYIERGHNFTIKLLKKVNGKVVEDGVLYAAVNRDSDKYLLRDEIKEAYKRNYGLDLNLDERPTKEITTIVDPKTNAKGVPILDDSKDPMYSPTRETRI